MARTRRRGRALHEAGADGEASRRVGPRDRPEVESMMRAPGAAAVTLVVPVRNEADTLEAFLASLDEQVVPPGAIVLVDAGSTDSTGTVLEQYAMRMPHVRIVEAGAALPGL